MSQDQAKQFLMQGIEAAKGGQKDQARQLFQNTLRLDPQNETAWLWMSSVARDNRERLFCLQNLLQINPQNEMALKAVQAMGVNPQELIQQQEHATTSQTSAAAVSIPGLGGDHLNAAIQAADLFVRNYRAIPVDTSEAEWGLKDRLRYGEAAAIRQRTIRYALFGAGIVAAFVVLFVALVLLLSGGGAAVLESRKPTPTLTFTPTNTATATPGVTNTPSPVPANPQPTFAPPEGLQRGDIFGGTPTPIFPPVDSGLGQEFANAVALYSIGQYEEAVSVYERERESALDILGECKPDTYYYHILGLAEDGGRQNLDDAEFLYEDALRRGCDQEPLIFTAACVVEYLQGLETGDTEDFINAEGWCNAALEAAGNNRPIVLASTTRARLHLLNENYVSAASVLDIALRSWPADLNLLLVRARVELERGDLQQALRFIQQALYVDPVSEQALRLRVTAFLEIAAQTENRQQQVQLYGTAVTWTQEYLIFYPGEPIGYLMLAQARLGEGNDDLAEIALSRIIAAENIIPENRQEAVQEAHTLRAELYQRQARLGDALNDIEDLLETRPDDLALIEQQANLSFQLGRWALAQEGITTVLEAVAADEEAEPRIDLEMRQLLLTTQICEFTIDVDCDYEGALEILDDNFVFDLDDDDALLARSLRAKARYHVTLDTDEGDLSQFQRQTAYQQALDDIETVLDTNETALDQYYRGLILEQLNNPEEALLAYEWVEYWSQFYDYPFIEEVEDRITELRPEEEEEEEDS
jgi:tetratricopeptide (TPR) repeat protein